MYAVRIYSHDAGDKLQTVAEWAEAARVNLVDAVRKHFSQDGLLTVTAPVEVDGLYPTGLHGPDGPSCGVGSPLPALAEEAGTDLFVLVDATDRVSTTGRRWRNVGLGAALVIGLPLIIIASPFLLIIPLVQGGLEGLAHAKKTETGIATPADEAVFCLIDVRRGEVLWSLVLPVGMSDLRKAADADQLVEQAYGEFKAAHGP